MSDDADLKLLRPKQRLHPQAEGAKKEELHDRAAQVQNSLPTRITANVA